MTDKCAVNSSWRPAVGLRCILAGALLAAFLSGCSTQSSGTPEDSSAVPLAQDMSASADFFAMNTYMTITAYGPEAREAVDSAKEEVYSLENRLSGTIAASDISQINSMAGKGAVQVSQETFGLLASAVSYSEKTGGVFDITIAPVMDLWGFGNGNYRVPAAAEIQSVLPLVDWHKIILDENSRMVELPSAGMKLDLGGIAKGYASDKVQEIMKGYDVSSAAISLGGNVAVFGTKEDGSLFRIAIADPESPESYVGVLTATDVSVITSGGYERNFTENGVTYIHIMDPSTGAPAVSDLLSVTIVTPDGVQGDSLSTALFVMGKDKAVAYWREHMDFSFILVTSSGEVLASSDLKDTFALVNTEDTLTFIT